MLVLRPAGTLAILALAACAGLKTPAEPIAERAGGPEATREAPGPMAREKVPARETLSAARAADVRALRRLWMRLEGRFENMEPELARIDALLSRSIERDLDRAGERVDALAETSSEAWHRLRTDLEIDLSRIEGDILAAEQRVATVRRQ